ncbi:DJ-1/PfpI family protein [Oscillatoria sp. CS-180]|uniref:DJ-1/PfpI family protein n=1 Tax=Oscillatoria sp. CS-180 TaxID=3021720 RepID=UPI00233069AB|nr:DJ-1/PfpI family protein [Oscillatoria sp. CS-180]MDB9524829.1 DJ-1/PfpI family protein [Oscillatoria sp. CS-180]
MSVSNQRLASSSPLPAYVPRFNRAKPVIAVVGENRATELTDYVVPYGVLSESGVAQVWAIATQKGPLQMFPSSLQIEPQATVAEFDQQFPEGADYVVVPAVVHAKDPALLAWINQQATKGATMVGICDGAWVLANAGLMAGRKGVGHWFSAKRLAKRFPDTEWLSNVRYVADGNVITTTGIAASIPVSVALVAAIAGRDQTAALAQRIGVQSWSAEHQTELFKLSANTILTGVVNGLSFWSHENIGISITDEVDEIALALVTDAYSRTLRSKVLLAAADGEVKTKRGLVVLPDKVQRPNKRIDRTIELQDTLPPISSLDITLQNIEQLYGSATAKFIALQLEYSAHR